VLSTKKVGEFPIRYGQRLLEIGLLRSPRKYFYCHEINYLFLFCLKKTEDEKKELILVNKFTVKFTNGEPILIGHDISIKNCIRKHLLLLIGIMI